MSETGILDWAALPRMARSRMAGKRSERTLVMEESPLFPKKSEKARTTFRLFSAQFDTELLGPVSEARYQLGRRFGVLESFLYAFELAFQTQFRSLHICSTSFLLNQRFW
jgi:hypothetical protein